MTNGVGMNLKKLFVSLLSVAFLATTPNISDAGIFSKTVKGVGTGLVVKSISRAIGRKVIQNAEKDTGKALLKNELKVGKYGNLKQSPEKGLDYHHMPSTKQIEQYGVKKNDGIAMGVEHDRHSVTGTYKSGNKPILKANESPREALGRDVRDMRQIYQKNGLYDANVRKSLQDVIEQNKTAYPNLYTKPTTP